MSYRTEVARLLERIDDQRRRLLVLEAYGLRGPALAELKRETKRTRQQLAALVGGRRAEAAPAA